MMLLPQSNNPSLTFWEQVALQVLDWPVIAIVGIVVLFVLFRKQVAKILERGGLMIEWGDKKLSLSELSEELDESFAPVTDDLEELRERLTALEAAVPEAVERPAPGELAPVDREAARQRIFGGLENSKYRWRSIPRLASIAGVTEAQVRDILSADENVVLSRGKSGREIARFKNK